MWVEFIVGYRPCYEGFSPGSLALLPSPKPTLLNSNSIENQSVTGLFFARLSRATPVTQNQLILLLFFKSNWGNLFSRIVRKRIE